MSNQANGGHQPPTTEADGALRVIPQVLGATTGTRRQGSTQTRPAPAGTGTTGTPSAQSRQDSTRPTPRGAHAAPSPRLPGSVLATMLHSVVDAAVRGEVSCLTVRFADGPRSTITLAYRSQSPLARWLKDKIGSVTRS
jgi:hypothetical protein